MLKPDSVISFLYPVPVAFRLLYHPFLMPASPFFPRTCPPSRAVDTGRACLPRWWVSSASISSHLAGCFPEGSWLKQGCGFVNVFRIENPVQINFPVRNGEKRRAGISTTLRTMTICYPPVYPYTINILGQCMQTVGDCLNVAHSCNFLAWSIWLIIFLLGRF